MNKQQAIARMYGPGDKRPGKQQNGVIQIWVTRACDRACFNCTQASNLGPLPIESNGKSRYEFITPEQFEQAVITLKDYFGVVGVFGGNPAIHPKFELLCEILRCHIPKRRCGLWCNNPLGKAKAMRVTFAPGASNLNVHLDRKAYDEFRRDWPECKPFGLSKDSRHSPVYVALQDVIPDEQIRWELVSNCDINRYWSAMICVFRGELRGYFCEIAGAQAMLHQSNPHYPDLGVTIEHGWWRRPMADYTQQVEFHCHRCGVPLRGYGELAQAPTSCGSSQFSKCHQPVYVPKANGGQVQLVTDLHEVKPESLGRFTNYVQNASVRAKV